MQQQVKRERRKLIHSIENLLEGPMIFLGFVWLVLLIAELLWGLNPTLTIISTVIWIIFIVDFLVKFILAPEKLAYLKKNWLVAISLVLPALRVFRLLRIVRLARGVRFVRVLSSLNRSIKSLGATMDRRGFGYVMLLALVVTCGGAAGMLAFEKGNPGFTNYGNALYWTAMRVITAGSEHWPVTTEGRGLAFILALFGYAIFGYVTATIASYFIGRDVEEKKVDVYERKLDEILKVLKERGK